jgi:metal-responsive CopG/Arc/MetJ family transcriptional regulator
MAAKPTPEPEKLRTTSVRLPEDILRQIDDLGDHVRGGSSEVIRRALKSGLPVVRLSLNRNTCK